VELTNEEIYLAKAPLETLLKSKLPFETSYAVASLANKLRGQFKLIEDVRLSLVNTYGEQNEDGSMSVKQNSPKWPEFINGMSELFAKTINVDFVKIKLPKEVSGQEFVVEPEVLLNLYKFIEVN
jgi:hypothetical protein